MEILYDFLSNREQYVAINNSVSYIETMDVGCVQGSVLGPTIFSLFISPLDELISRNIIGYADDSYNYVYSRNIDYLKTQLEEVLRKHIIWLTNSGLVVNEEKTEIIILHKKEEITMDIKLDKQELKKPKMN